MSSNVLIGLGLGLALLAATASGCDGPCTRHSDCPIGYECASVNVCLVKPDAAPDADAGPEIDAGPDAGEPVDAGPEIDAEDVIDADLADADEPDAI